MGGPASLSFSIIGDAAAAFFAILGMTVAGGLPLGALLHYLIGLVFGALFGAAMSRIAVLQLSSPIKAVGLVILSVELISQPLLSAAAWALHMTAPETAQWFGISFAPGLCPHAWARGVLRIAWYRQTNVMLRTAAAVARTGVTATRD